MKADLRAPFYLLRLFLVLFALAAPAGADVIVYKGSARAALDARTQFSKMPRLYFVVDNATKTSTIVLYYKLNDAKALQILPIDHTRYAGESIAVDTRIGTFTSAIDRDFGASGFAATMLYLRGRETLLVLANSGVPVTGNFPKVLTGILRQAQVVGALSTTFELNITLAFDSLHTQSANNGFKDGMTTVNDIVSELTALGY